MEYYEGLMWGAIIGAVICIPIVWIVAQSLTPQGLSLMQGHQNQEVKDIERDSKGFIKRIVTHREVRPI